MESLGKVISQNSQHAQSFITKCSSDLHRSKQKQVKDLIKKEKQNTSNLQALEKLQRDTTGIVEEQYHWLEEAKVNLTFPMTSEAEISKARNFSGAKP